MIRQSKQDSYKLENELFLKSISEKEGINHIAKGLLYEVLKKGRGVQPRRNSVVAVYYKGSLVNGKIFDDNTSQGYPDAFRLRELIEGWQIALLNMKVGDRWRIYLPASLGYGSRGTAGIPKHSTLIFEIELVSVA